MAVKTLGCITTLKEAMDYANAAMKAAKSVCASSGYNAYQGAYNMIAAKYQAGQNTDTSAVAEAQGLLFAANVTCATEAGKKPPTSISACVPAKSTTTSPVTTDAGVPAPITAGLGTWGWLAIIAAGGILLYSIFEKKGKKPGVAGAKPKKAAKSKKTSRKKTRK